MWLKRETYLDLLAENRGMRRVLATNRQEIRDLGQEARNNSVSVGELSAARKGLITLAKARKQQLRDHDLDPVGQDDMAEWETVRLIEEVEAIVHDLQARMTLLEQKLFHDPYQPLTQDQADDLD